jgi:hypothetical protein
MLNKADQALSLSVAKKTVDREAEIANLQRKVILLYEELRNKTSCHVNCVNKYTVSPVLLR